MYAVGDKIIYGRNGVCTVESIVPKRLSGEKAERLFYNLRPLYQNCSICIPVDSKVFSRPIISGEEARQLILSLPDIEAEPCRERNLNRLREHYHAIIESCDCRRLAELMRSVYLKRRESEESKRKLGALDERFMKEAEDLLFGELAAALDIQRCQVRGYIDGIFNSG